MSEKLIEVKNLKKYFSAGMFRRTYVKAVDGVSFHIAKGETLALVGESGCGKSTVGRCTSCLIEPTCGEIYFETAKVSGSTINLRDLRKKVQVIFQDANGSLNPRMRVRDLIVEPMKVHRLVNGNASERVSELLEMVSLTNDLAGRYPHELSGGQRQRVCIARAMALKPEFIVADEPAASLDLLVQAQILDLMRRLQEAFGISYLFISHDLKIVRLMADRVAVMYLGEFVEVADTDKIFDGSAHPYTQALFSGVPSTDPSSTRRKIVLEGEIPSALNPPLGCKFHPRCPQAKAICSQVKPDLSERENGHVVACHFAT